MKTCATCGGVFDGSDPWGGPDPCLGLLPGVISACCGHGVGCPFTPYLWTETVGYEGQVALEQMRDRGGAPPAGDYKPGTTFAITDRHRAKL